MGQVLLNGISGMWHYTSTRETNVDSLLELKPEIRAGVKYPDGSWKSERHFLDFVVNGESLWKIVGQARDMVSVLCSEYDLNETTKAVHRLLLREQADLPDNRRSLFICSECGNLGCGTITVVVAKHGGAIVWKNFGYENNYEDHVLLDEYGSIGPFTFNAVEYERTLLDGLTRVTGEPKS